jgi:hypothetical protein
LLPFRCKDEKRKLSKKAEIATFDLVFVSAANKGQVVEEKRLAERPILTSALNER